MIDSFGKRIELERLRMQADADALEAESVQLRLDDLKVKRLRLELEQLGKSADNAGEVEAIKTEIGRLQAQREQIGGQVEGNPENDAERFVSDLLDDIF